MFNNDCKFVFASARCVFNNDCKLGSKGLEGEAKLNILLKNRLFLCSIIVDGLSSTALYT